MRLGRNSQRSKRHNRRVWSKGKEDENLRKTCPIFGSQSGTSSEQRLGIVMSGFSVTLVRMVALV